jgi:hypothetical protein
MWKLLGSEMAVTEIEHLSIFICENQWKKELSIKEGRSQILHLIWSLNIRLHNTMLKSRTLGRTIVLGKLN